jgi:hypothetical protein
MSSPFILPALVSVSDKVMPNLLDSLYWKHARLSGNRKINKAYTWGQTKAFNECKVSPDSSKKLLPPGQERNHVAINYKFFSFQPHSMALTTKFIRAELCVLP